MGFPMIQVALIAARQISKPVADAVLSYGKSHPAFRTKILLPVGGFIVRFTTRLRMKGLGLGEVASNVKVSEAAALEQASDFVQQLVIFTYSVTLFAGYYFYIKLTSEESVKVEDFKKIQDSYREVEELCSKCNGALDEMKKEMDIIVKQNQDLEARTKKILIFLNIEDPRIDKIVRQNDTSRNGR